MKTVQSTVREAIEVLTASGNRSEYARAVLRGYQNWSGSDLQGKAKRFGGSYARQRGNAREALEQAGGQIIALASGGKLVSAVEVCTDDFGRTILHTRSGYVAPTGRGSRCAGI